MRRRLPRALIVAAASALLAACASVGPDTAGPAATAAAGKPAPTSATAKGASPASAATAAAPASKSGTPAPSKAKPAAPATPAATPVVADDPPPGDSIFFTDGKKTLDEIDKELLRRHVARLKDEPRLVLTLVAHTPRQGSHSYNLALAADWLEEIMKALRAAGVPRKQLLKEHALRSRDPQNCTTDACRRLLRRVDFVYR